jgi:hypothetical protein
MAYNVCEIRIPGIAIAMTEMSVEDLEQLALDALYGRRINRRGCIVFNVAGEELFAAPQEVIPIVERVLLETVEPILAESKEDLRVSQIRENLKTALPESVVNQMPIRSRDFSGLDYLLGAYLVIAARSDPDVAVRFLARVSAALQVEALAAIEIFFMSKADGYVRGIAPPVQFRAFVRQLAESRCEKLRSVAERTLIRVTWAS